MHAQQHNRGTMSADLAERAGDSANSASAWEPVLEAPGSDLGPAVRPAGAAGPATGCHDAASGAAAQSGAPPEVPPEASPADPTRIRSRWDPHTDKPRPTPFARWLTASRLQQNLKQSDLAAVLRVSSGRISELETGARRPSRDLARRLHEALGEVPPPPWPPD